jgi:uncharacterized protein YkwD
MRVVPKYQANLKPLQGHCAMKKKTIWTLAVLTSLHLWGMTLSKGAADSKSLLPPMTGSPQLPNPPGNLPPPVAPNPGGTLNPTASVIGQWKNQKGGDVFIYQKDGRVLVLAPEFKVNGSVEVNGNDVTMPLTDGGINIILKGKITAFDPTGRATKIEFGPNSYFHREAVAGNPNANPGLQPPANVELTKEEKEVMDIINQERAKHSMPPLQANALLMQAAKGHAANMSQTKQFTNELDGKRVDKRVADTGYQAQFVDENIAKFGGKDFAFGQKVPYLPAETVPFMINHPTQKNRILGQRFTEIGIGITVDADGTTWWNLVFASH